MDRQQGGMATVSGTSIMIQDLAFGRCLARHPVLKTCNVSARDRSSQYLQHDMDDAVQPVGVVPTTRVLVHVD